MPPTVLDSDPPGSLPIEPCLEVRLHVGVGREPIAHEAEPEPRERGTDDSENREAKLATKPLFRAIDRAQVDRVRPVCRRPSA